LYEHRHDERRHDPGGDRIVSGNAPQSPDRSHPVSLPSSVLRVPSTQHEAGFVSADQRLHAVKKRIDGSSALCGAGRIVQQVPGRFDAADPTACADCVTAVDEPA
jgi:hypothetical protein